MVTPELKADKTVAKPGEIITFTWEWDKPDDGADLSRHSQTFRFSARRSGSTNFEVIESDINQNIRTVQAVYPSDNPDWDMYKVCACYYSTEYGNYEYNSNALWIMRDAVLF